MHSTIPAVYGQQKGQNRAKSHMTEFFFYSKGQGFISAFSKGQGVTKRGQGAAPCKRSLGRTLSPVDVMLCPVQTRLFMKSGQGNANASSPRPKTWGVVAQWIERATDNRVVARSNPTETAWKLWQFPLPHFASVFRKRH